MFEFDFEAIINFVVYFWSGVAAFTFFSFIYVKCTPINEIQLIKNGNLSAAISLSGAMLGFGFPLAKSIEQSVSALEFLQWAIFAAILQISIFYIIHKAIPELESKINADEKSYALFLAAIAVVVGLINSASMSG